MQGLRKQSGAKALCEAFSDLSIDTIFGVVGHGNLALIDALCDFPKIKFISTYHEQIAVHAADAYYRSSNRVSVVATTVGPGATNLVTGLADALLDSSALVAMTSGVPSDYSSRDPLQVLSVMTEDSQSEIFRPVCKRVIVVRNVEELVPLFVRAFYLAQAGSPGPVVLHVPMDFYSDDVTTKSARIARPIIPRPGANESELREIQEALKSSSKPLLLSGGGVIRSQAWQELEEFSVKNQIPVATTMSGQGSFSANHFLYLGTVGVVGTELGNYALRNSDCVLALGTQFPEMDSHSWDERFFPTVNSSKIVHVDIEYNRFYRSVLPSKPILSDVKVALSSLNLLSDLASKEAWLDDLAAVRLAWEKKKNEIQVSNDSPFEPAALLSRLVDLLPYGISMTAGVGVRHAVAQHFQPLKAGSLIVGSGFGTMGQETGAAIGAVLANDNSQHVIAVIGDGSLLANPQALAVATSYGLKIIWIILDNGGYASIAVYQRKHFGRRKATIFAEETGSKFCPDYIGLSRSLGVPATKIFSLEELAPSLEASFATQGPSMIVAPIKDSPRNLGSGFWVVNDILARRSSKN